MAQNIIEKFYQAFQNMDAETMAACYHPEVVFHDPAFGRLEGAHAANMWRMLIKSQEGKDFKIEYGEVKEDENTGSAKWEAWYTFGATGNRVHNSITATFELRDGLIIKHDDVFNLYRWSQQALGLQGTLIGWTGFFRKKLQSRTNRMLAKFESSL